MQALPVGACTQSVLFFLKVYGIDQFACLSSVVVKGIRVCLLAFTIKIGRKCSDSDILPILYRVGLLLMWPLQCACLMAGVVICEQ